VKQMKKYYLLLDVYDIRYGMYSKSPKARGSLPSLKVDLRLVLRSDFDGSASRWYHCMLKGPVGECCNDTL